jgi:membrane dipeptidase
MKKFVVLFMLVLRLTPSSAQQRTIFGSITDKVTHAAVESVQVSLVNKSNPSLHYSAVSDKSGLWTITFVTNVAERSALVPTQFALAQNYPNPFNPSTKIQFFLPHAGIAVLTVHTVLGQELDRMELSVSAGLTEVAWESKGSAGVLFYTIEFEKTRITRKMIQLDGGHGRGFGSAHTIAGAPMFAMASVAESPEYDVFSSKLGYETDTTTVTLVEQTHANIILETVHNRAFMWDLHNDVMESVLAGYQMIGPRPDASHQTDLAGWKQGGLDAQMISIYIDPSGQTNYYQRTLNDIGLFDGQMAANPTLIGQARTPAEVRALASQGKIAAVLGLEGGHSIENNISNLITLYQRGIRYCTITWNNSTSWAASAKDEAAGKTGGLSEFGRQVIRTLDSLGVIIDVSHVGVKTIDDILAVTKNPIIASHSGAWALNHHYRNLTDLQLKAIAARGGVVGVVFYPPFLSSTSKATLDTVVKHIDYIKNLVGVDFIAIGSDFDGIGRDVPAGLENVTKYPDLTMALLRHGYTPSDVRKILGANYMRVFEAVCH